MDRHGYSCRRTFCLSCREASLLCAAPAMYVTSQRLLPRSWCGEESELSIISTRDSELLSICDHMTCGPLCCLPVLPHQNSMVFNYDLQNVLYFGLIAEFCHDISWAGEYHTTSVYRGNNVISIRSCSKRQNNSQHSNIYLSHQVPCSMPQVKSKPINRFQA